MGTSAQKIVSEAMALPPALRAFVAEILLESLDLAEAPKLSAKWRKEIRRRCTEVDRRTVKLHDADAVFAKAYSSLRSLK